MNYYTIFGLTVRCDIPLPEAALSEPCPDADVRVRIGAVDSQGRARLEADGVWFICDETQMFFRCPAGIYEIREGREIIIEPVLRPVENDLRTFLLGTAFGLLQTQRGDCPIHGGCVKINNKALIISGESGTGKSTLTGALVKEGHPFLSDDVCTVRVVDGAVLAVPAYPQLKLCRHTCENFGYDPDRLPLLSEDRQKYAVRRPELWCPESTLTGAMVEIVLEENADAPRLRTVTGREKLLMLLRNHYRGFVLEQMGIPPWRMKRLLQIASATVMYRIVRPSQGNTLSEIVSMVETLEPISAAK